MSDIPDKVISDAVKAVPATQAGVGSARMVRQIVVPAAPVIAAWARAEERQRIREQVKGMRPPLAWPESMRAGFLAARNRVDTALAALDRDGSADTREGGK